MDDQTAVEHSYLTLGAAQMDERRVARVHTLEQRRFDLRLQAEETGGYDATMSDEANELERRIAYHAAIVWGVRDGQQQHDPDRPGDGEPSGADQADQADNADGLDAHRHAFAHADGPSPSHVDPHAEMPAALGHEEDDLPDAASDAEDAVPHDPGTDSDVPLGHVEHDAEVLALRPEHELAVARTQGHDSEGEPVGAEDGEPGRHTFDYTRGRGSFDRVGDYPA